MRRRPPPWMALHIAPLLLDTEGMPTDAFGAYVRILCHMWVGGGQLPDDDRVLSRLAGVSLFKWRKLRPLVIAYLTPIPNKRAFTQKRLLTELWLCWGFGKIRASRKASSDEGHEPEIPGLFVATRERARGQDYTDTENNRKRMPARSRLGLAREAAARGELPPVSDELQALIKQMGLSK